MKPETRLLLLLLMLLGSIRLKRSAISESVLETHN